MRLLLPLYARFRVRPHAGQIDAVSTGIIHLNLIGQNAIVDGAQVRRSELSISCGRLCALNERLLAHLVLLRVIVQVGIEHYSRVREQKRRVLFIEKVGLCRSKCVGESLHTSFNRSCLARQPKTLKEHAERVVETKSWECGQSYSLDVFSQRSHVQLSWVAHVLANLIPTL